MPRCLHDQPDGGLVAGTDRIPVAVALNPEALGPDALSPNAVNPDRYRTPMPSVPVWLEHPSSLLHDTVPHPEQPARITAIERELSARGWLGFERETSPAVDRSLLEAVHPAAYVDAIERACMDGGGFLDADTVISTHSFEAALHAAGGAVRIVDLLLDGDAPCAFSAHRPPGHHALPKRAMGFCLFNNIAVAARYALDVRGLERVMIVDWDVHHGNGTNDIFHASNEVLFVSIHQSPLYPGTGQATDAGSGEGRGFTVNLPVPPGAGDLRFCSLVDHVVVPLARSFEPQLMLVSAGYDAHRDDPLAACEVTEAGYAAMTRSIRGVSDELGIRVGCVLEGGYALDALAKSVAATLGALAEPALAPAPAAASASASASEAEARAEAEGAADGDVPQFVTQARARLAQWWPALA